MKRHPERGAYDRATIDSVLDEALICHVGFVHDGQPFVIPTIHARDGDTLYLHGSPGSRMLRNLKQGIDVCVTATLLDGLVLARSVYHHSMNYRSAVVLGRAREVTDRAEKLYAMECVVDHVVRGRWADARQPSQGELDGTTILAVALDEASAKIRSRRTEGRRPRPRARRLGRRHPAYPRGARPGRRQRPARARLRRALYAPPAVGYAPERMTSAGRTWAWAWRRERGGSLRPD